MPLVRIISAHGQAPAEGEPTYVDISEEVIATALTLHASTSLTTLAETREAIIRPTVLEHEAQYRNYAWNDEDDTPYQPLFEGPSHQLGSSPPGDTTPSPHINTSPPPNPIDASTHGSPHRLAETSATTETPSHNFAIPTDQVITVGCWLVPMMHTGTHPP